MRGVRSTLVLFVLAVGLGGYAYFIEGERPAAPSEAPLDAKSRSVDGRVWMVGRGRLCRRGMGGR